MLYTGARFLLCPNPFAIRGLSSNFIILFRPPLPQVTNITYNSAKYYLFSFKRDSPNEIGHMVMYYPKYVSYLFLLLVLVVIDVLS